MKTCTLCKVTQIESGSWCKECNKNYASNYRKTHKKKLQQLNKTWRKNNFERYKEMKYVYYKSKKGRIVDLLHAARKRSKEKGLTCELTTELIENMWKMQNGKCALTDIEFQIPQERTGGKASPFAPSIDRIDCNKGYTQDNVRLVCVAVNYALNEFGEETFRKVCEAYLSSSKK